MPVVIFHCRNVVCGLLISFLTSCRGDIKMCNQQLNPRIHWGAPAGSYVTTVHYKKCTVCAVESPPRPLGDAFYKIINIKDSDYFKIDLISGVLTTKKKIDRDLYDKFEIIVLVLRKEETILMHIDIDIRRYNWDTVRFREKLYGALILENVPLRTTVLRVKAEAEAERRHRYTFRYSLDKTGAGSYFTIDEKTGSISLIKRPLWGLQHFVSLKIFVSDCNSPKRVSETFAQVLFTNNSGPNISECRGKLCIHGICKTTDNEAGYICQCDDSFKGDDCGVENLCGGVETPCHNSGYCSLRPHPYRRGWNNISNFCRCNPGFQGLRCEINGHKCKDSPCMNGGRCEDIKDGYRCHCKRGFKGLQCETKTYCEEETVELDEGNFTWVETSTWYYAYHKCPFGLQYPNDNRTNARRRCGWDNRHSAEWETWEVGMCRRGKPIG